MAKSVSHPISTRNSNISPRTECDVIQIVTCIVVLLYVSIQKANFHFPIERKTYKHFIIIFKPRIFYVQMYCEVIYAINVQVMTSQFRLLICTEKKNKIRGNSNKKNKGVPERCIKRCDKGAIKVDDTGCDKARVIVLYQGCKNPVFHNKCIINAI